MLRILPLIMLALSACTPQPVLPPAPPEAVPASTPQLLPLSRIDARVAEVTVSDQDAAEAQARGDALRAKAERLRAMPAE